MRQCCIFAGSRVAAMSALNHTKHTDWVDHDRHLNSSDPPWPFVTSVNRKKRKNTDRNQANFAVNTPIPAAKHLAISVAATAVGAPDSPKQFPDLQQRLLAGKFVLYWSPLIWTSKNSANASAHCWRMSRKTTETAISPERLALLTTRPGKKVCKL